jgi:hypothetical protein
MAVQTSSSRQCSVRGTWGSTTSSSDGSNLIVQLCEGFTHVCCAELWMFTK